VEFVPVIEALMLPAGAEDGRVVHPASAPEMASLLRLVRARGPRVLARRRSRRNRPVR
jgi:hypothetical protein